MATYVMSDIHGEIDRYHKMLELINFSSDDQLYIIGDVIDRGADGVSILLEIIDKGNVHFIIGNHEDMMLGTHFVFGISAGRYAVRTYLFLKQSLRSRGRL